MEQENTIILELWTSWKYLKSVAFSWWQIDEGWFQRWKKYWRVSSLLWNSRNIDFDLYYKMFNGYLSWKSKLFLLNCLLSWKVEWIRWDVKSELWYYWLLFNSSDGYILNPLLYSVWYEWSKSVWFYTQAMIEVMREKFLNKEKRDKKPFKPFNLILIKCTKKK